MAHSAPIGVFDSGVGGLTVVRAIRAALPEESIIYLGDTARVPYGNRGEATVRRYSLNATQLLIDRGVKAIVVACNTATAYALPALQRRWSVPVLGVVAPVAAAAAERSQTGHIGVIGTRGTISSGCYPEALGALNPALRSVQIACPLFVPLAEEGWLDGAIPEQVAQVYLEPLVKTQVDTLILGCTHYPLLRPAIAHVLDRMMPRKVALLDSAQATTSALVALLDREGLRAPSGSSGVLTTLVTDDPKGFAPLSSRFAGEYIGQAEHVDIHDKEWSDELL
jgi:glutamate racemase